MQITLDPQFSDSVDMAAAFSNMGRADFIMAAVREKIARDKACLLLPARQVDDLRPEEERKSHISKVYAALLDGKEYTLNDLCAITGLPHNEQVARRIRDLRAQGMRIPKRKLGTKRYAYRMEG